MRLLCATAESSKKVPPNGFGTSKVSINNTVCVSHIAFKLEKIPIPDVIKAMLGKPVD